MLVTPEQLAQYQNGQPIVPVKVLFPAPAAKSQEDRPSLFDRTHDFIGRFIPTDFKTNPDYYSAAQFDQSDQVSEPVLLSIRGGFAMYLVINMLMTFWLNTDGIMHMWYFFTYWGVAATMFAMVYAMKAV